MTLSTLSSRAIIVDSARDNVALAVTDVAPGRYELASGEIEVAEPVAPGQRIALRDIPAGAFLVQYGCPFAISRGIRRPQLIPLVVHNNYRGNPISPRKSPPRPA